MTSNVGLFLWFEFGQSYFDQVSLYDLRRNKKSVTGGGGVDYLRTDQNQD